ncbi:MAG: nuclear transport factor 2 family protein [Chloroflexota bacterium]|nr:MAG: nuclear transport factor 2 family protein [Chloroflexota bacterium]
MEAEDTIRDLEARRLAVLVAGDIDAAEALHADDYELITPGGASYTKRRYLDAIASGDLRYKVFEAASAVRVLVRGDTAILRYKVLIDVTFAPGEVDADHFWHTDYWEQRDGRWQAVWSQATRIR